MEELNKYKIKDKHVKSLNRFVERLSTEQKQLIKNGDYINRTED